MATFAVLVFPACMMAAAVSDLLRMTISNRLQIVLSAGFLVAALLAGMTPSTIAVHLATGVCVLLLTFGCFAAGWMGGGDAKLIAATALWFGPGAALTQYVVTAAFYGGLLTVVLLVCRSMCRPATGVVFVDRLLTRGIGVPYGIALGAAGLAVFVTSPWMPMLPFFSR